MSRMDQAKMLMKMRKLQKELQKEMITAEAGEGAVKVEINESHLKRIKELNEVDCEIYEYVRKTEKK